MKMDFLNIFLEDFRGPKVLKSCAQKVQVMTRCGPNLQTLNVFFLFLK